MTSPDREPPPMVPSARKRVVQVAGCFTLPEYPDEVCRAADAARLVEHAYRDGWNAAHREEVMQHTERPEQPIRQETLRTRLDNTQPPVVMTARLNAALAERDQINFDEGRAFERRAALAAQQSNQVLDELAAETERLGGLYRPSDDEARRRAIIEDACARAFGPDGGERQR